MSILRNLIAIVGLIAAAGIIVLVANKGYTIGATPLDRLTTGLVYSIIALTGLVGPAVARYLYLVPKLKPLGALLGIISAAALITNVTNLVGAAPGVFSVAPTQSVSNTSLASVADPPRAIVAPDKNEVELQRIAAERAALYFNPTTQAAVASARAAYIEADVAHRAECSERHNSKCEELAADLAAKQNAFLAIARDRSATEQAEELDTQAARISARLNAATPSAGAQPSQRSKVPHDLVSNLPDRGTPTWQQIFAALTGELAIACSLSLWSLPSRPSKSAAINRAIGDIPNRSAKRVPAVEGDLTRFVHECMTPAGGESVELRALYSRFLDWCDEKRLSALPPRKFSQAFAKRCAEAQIEVRYDGQDLVCLDVRLAPAHLLH